jgi:hypothetical protein
MANIGSTRGRNLLVIHRLFREARVRVGVGGDKIVSRQPALDEH